MSEQPPPPPARFSMFVDTRPPRVDVGGRNQSIHAFLPGEIQASNLGKGTDGLARLGKAKREMESPLHPPPSQHSATRICKYRCRSMFAQVCKSPMCQSVYLPPTVAQQQLPRSHACCPWHLAGPLPGTPHKAGCGQKTRFSRLHLHLVQRMVWWHVSSRHRLDISWTESRKRSGEHFLMILIS